MLPPDRSLVSTEWLAERLGSAGLVVLDGSFKMPGATPTARQDYEARHIPGAVFFDIDEIADPQAALPHMLPAPDLFAEAMGRLGISNSTSVVVYDTPGLMSAGRVWWSLRVFGHERVAVLDGGLKAWLAEGRPVESAVPEVRPARYRARFNSELVRSKAQIRANLSGGGEQVVDARSAGRFTGADAEPWPGRRSGRIPGSHSLPFDRLTSPQSGRLLPGVALRDLFRDAGLDFGKPVVATCGSGVTAAALAFALHLLGHEEVAVYDGSWAEWGLPGDTPVETG